MARTLNRRFETRMDEETDDLIERAAELTYQSKSSFVTGAARQGICGAVGSLEMSGKQLTTRAIATAASVDLNRIRQRTLSETEKQRCRIQAANLRKLPITFMDATDQTGPVSRGTPGNSGPLGNWIS